MVKKPRANRSAAPRKPVIIEAEAKPVEPKGDPNKGPGSAEAVKKAAAAPATPKEAAGEKPKATSTPNAARKAVSTDAVKPPVKKEEPPVPAKTDTPKSEKAEKPKEDKSTQPKSEGGSGSGTIKGGIAGAILAMLGAVGLNYAGILPGGGSSTDTTALSSLEAKVEALSNSAATPAPEFDPNTVQPLVDAALEKQSAAFNAEIEALNAKLAESDNSAGDDVSGQISALEQQVKDLQAALSSGSAGENEGMTVLATRVDTVETGLSTLQQSLSTIGDGAMPEGMSETLNAVQQSATQNAEQINGLATSLQTTKEETMAAITALSDDVAAKITDLGSQVETLGTQAADTSRQADVAGAIATAGLKAAIDRGGPFMAELETYAQVAPDSAITEQLRPLAAKGVPTQSDLLKQFDGVAYDMIAAAEAPAEGEGGVLSGLMSSAKSLVKVRPVGSVEGDSAGAITARMGEALKSANYAGVEAEFAALPEAAQAAGADFIAALQARQQADRLVQDVLNKALQSSAPAANQ